MYRLIIEDDEGRTTIVPLIRNQINIGREEGNTIRLTERNVSRRHAKLLLKNGQIQIEDLKSYNGVWINGSRIKGRSSLRPGDLLEIGDYHLSVQEESSDAEQHNARPSPPAHEDFDDQTPPVGIQPVGESDDDIIEIIATDPAVLLLLNTSEQGRAYDVELPAVMIGRTDENEIAIDHASISRHHAKIVCEEGVYQLHDLDSANGVLVNGQEFKVCDLRWGDVIELGQVRFKFCAVDDDLVTQAAQTPSGSRPVETEPPTKNLNMIIGIAVLLVLMGAGGIYMLMNKKDTSILPPPKRLNNNNGIAVRERGPSAARMAKELREEQQRQLKLAKNLFTQENYKGALSILERLSKVRSPWKEAEELQKMCKYEFKFFKLIQEGIELQAEGKMYAAYLKSTQVNTQSRYFARAQEAKKQAAPKAVAELLLKVKQSMVDKRYFVAMQWNSKVLDIDPKNEAAKKNHKQIEILTAPVSRTPTRVAPRNRDRVVPPKQRPDSRNTPDAGDSTSVEPRKRVPPPVRRQESPLAQCLKLMTSKKYRSSQRCFQRVLRRRGEKSVPKAHLHLGNVVAKRGSCFHVEISKRKQLFCLQATYHYNQFIRLLPNSAEAKKLKLRLKANQAPTPRREAPKE